jgi:hypothetical protein
MRTAYKGLLMIYVSVKCNCEFFLGWSTGSCTYMTPHLPSGTPYSHNHKDRSLPPNILYFLYLITITRIASNSAKSVLFYVKPSTFTFNTLNSNSRDFWFNFRTEKRLCWLRVFIVHFGVSCTVIVLTCFVMCGCVYVCVL